MIKLTSTTIQYDEESGNIRTTVKLNNFESSEYRKALELPTPEFYMSDIVDAIFNTSGNPRPYSRGAGYMFVDSPAFSQLKNNCVVVSSRFGRDC